MSIYQLLFTCLFFFRQGVFAPEAGHGRKVFAVRFHPFDDNIFLTGGWDRCIKVCTESELVHLFLPFPTGFPFLIF